MAKIPTYTSQSRALATSGVQRARGVSQQNNIGRAVAGVGDQLAQIGFGLLKAADDDAAHQARVNAQLKLQQLELDLQTEDPIGSMSTFAERAEAIIAEAGNGLSMNAQRSFDSAAREMVARSQIAVQKDSIIRGRQKLEANLVTNLTALANAIRPDDTAEDRSARMDDARELLQQAYANRIISADDGERKYRKFLNDQDLARAEFELGANPQRLERQLEEQEGEDKYNHLTGRQRASLTNRAKQKIKLLEKQGRAERNAHDTKIQKKVNMLIKISQAGGNTSEKVRGEVMDGLLANMHDKTKAMVLRDRFEDQIKYEDTRNTLDQNLSTQALLDIAESLEADATEGSTGANAEIILQNLKQRTDGVARIKTILDKRGADYADEFRRNLDAIRKTGTPTEAQEEAISDEKIAANVADPKVAEELRQVRDEVVTIASTITALQSAAPSRLTEIVAETGEAAAETAPTQAVQKVRESGAATVVKAVKAINTLRSKDPAQAILSSSNAARERYQEFGANQNPETYENFAAVRQAEFQRLGIPEANRRLLPKQYVTAIASDLSKRMEDDPQSVVNEINRLREVMGDDFDGLLNELTGAKLDDRVAAIMMVDNKDVQDRLITLMGQATTQELKQSVDTADLSKVLTAKMNDVTSAAGDRGVGLANTSRNAVELIALGYMRSGLSVNKAVDKAYDDIVSDNYLVVSLPRLRGIVAKSDRSDQSEFDASRVQNALGTWMERNADVQFDRRQFANLIPSSDAEEVAQEKMRSLLSSGSAVWIMSEDGTGANLTDGSGRVIQDDNGVPIKVLFDGEVEAHKKYTKEKSKKLRTRRRIRPVDTQGKIAGRP